MQIFNSKLYLCENVKLDPNYNYTMDFDTVQAQSLYFDSKVSNVLDINEGYSYIKNSQTLKVQVAIDDLININYFYYINKEKRYYAFITKKEYVSQTCTALNFKIDVMQTFMKDYSIEESFIDREHQDRYVKMNEYLEPIYNIEAENLEKGSEYIKKLRVKINDNIPENFTLATGASADKTFQLYWLTIVAKEAIGKKSWSSLGNLISGTQPSENKTTSVKGMPNNVFTYVAPLALFLGGWANAPVVRCTSKTGVTSATSILETFTTKQLMDLTQDPKVISINISRYCPFNYGCDKDSEVLTGYTATRYKLYPLPAPEGSWTNDITLSCYEFNTSTSTGSGAMFFINNPNERSYPILSTPYDPKLLASGIDKENEKSIAYEPKLNTIDYSYFEIELGSQKLKLNKEDFTPNDLKFEYLSSYSAKNGQAIIPLNYRQQAENIENMLSLDSNINEMPLRTDAWTEYLSANKSSMLSGFTTGALQAGAGLAIGLATGGLGFAVAGTQAISYAGGIANSLAQMNDIKNKPNDVKQTTIDLTLDYATRDLYITLNDYGIRDNFKSKIFNYFYHYGYKVNNFKVPNVRSRYYFNYIKTIGVNISSDIDSEYLDQIKSVYDNGTTIWHYRNSATFKGLNNYNYENIETNLIGG